ncbi:hypothetical protein CU097_006703 [Rhizopus azygosporus]|uniref:Bax inhibitor 1 n=1 Tax=Rhizopus azygosporus TaxID=86630 RepID=A0A367JS25_RHIAZ|nr:hypothetical protein CU097_006703 [Rhizopus azygosporus]
MSEKPNHYYYNSSNYNNNNALSRPVRRHLVNVYLTLAAMCAIATFGSHIGDYLGPSGTSIGSVGALGSMSMIRFTSINSNNRWGLLLAYSIFSGIAISTFISFILNWDPTGNIVFLSLTSAALVFLGFTLSALTSSRRSTMYIGALASSAISVLLWLSLANLFFFQSSNLFSFELYAGLLAFAGFVMYDTQMIIDRANAGIMDIPGHAIELFMDLYALFVRFANIFLKKEMERENDKRRRQRGGFRLQRE